MLITSSTLWSSLNLNWWQRQANTIYLTSGGWTMADERLYAKVVEELNQSGPIPGLWAKTFAECNGNDVEAKAMYLRLRVAQLAIEEVKLKSEGGQVQLIARRHYRFGTNL